jgi:hypothetical protein
MDIRSFFTKPKTPAAPGAAAVSPATPASVPTSSVPAISGASKFFSPDAASSSATDESPGLFKRRREAAAAAAIKSEPSDSHSHKRLSPASPPKKLNVPAPSNPSQHAVTDASGSASSIEFVVGEKAVVEGLVKGTCGVGYFSVSFMVSNAQYTSLGSWSIFCSFFSQWQILHCNSFEC